jgi:phosphoribosylformimino-5-aminoimidazole carboxamide ribotide isomerase
MRKCSVGRDIRKAIHANYRTFPSALRRQLRIWKGAMKIVPVLDLLKGQVVHAVAGQRANYRPIKSRLTASADPVGVATALHRHFGFANFYLADLDAIAGAEPAFSTFDALQGAGFRLWVDVGVVEADRAQALADFGVARIIVGLETVAGPHVLARICQSIAGQTIFSLDLHSGQPVRASGSWKNETWAILEQAIDAGVRAVLLLDLARVGVRSGTGTEALCARLVHTFPDVEVLAGGGIRDVCDLRRLEILGVKAALMATALHDGSVTAADLADFTR